VVQDDDSPAMTQTNHKRVEVLNSTLARTEKWFGSIMAEKVNHGRVVLLLPKTLTICPSCENICLTEDIVNHGKCHDCHDSSAMIEKEQP
jgi:hypothetical protein